MRHLSFCLLTVAAVLPAVCVCADNPGERRSVPWEKTCMMDNPDVKMSFYNSDFVQYFYDELISNGYWEDSDIEAPDGSRHKIITEQGLDVTTSVPVLPEGESVSVRLGTRGYAGDEAAKGGGVKFQYEVTEDNAILFASYSALVEDSWNDHLAELQKLVGQTVTYGGESYTIGDYSTITNSRWTFEQPIITFYIEKEGYRRSCTERSIFQYWETGETTQYGTVLPEDNYGHPAYYNPWTVMAVDLSPYIGQTISFGAEYHDCAEAGLLYLQKDGSTYYDSPIIHTCQDRHISRLYLHPSYGPARIQQTGEDCQTRTYTFSAPEGFKIYRWYTSKNKNVTLSDTQTCSYRFSSTEDEIELCCELKSRLTMDCGSTVLRLAVKNNCGGCDLEPVTRNETVAFCNGDRIVYEGTEYAGDTVLTDTIPALSGCDSIYRIVRLSYEPDTFITQRWNDFLSVSRTAYDKYGGFTGYQWYKDGTRLDGENGSQLYLPGEGLDSRSGYSVEMTCVADGRRIHTCPYYPVLQPNTVTLSVTPTVVSSADNAPLRIRASEPGEARLFNQSGAPVAVWRLREGDNSRCMPSVPGLYMLRVLTVSGGQFTRKIVVK